MWKMTVITVSTLIVYAGLAFNVDTFDGYVAISFLAMLAISQWLVAAKLINFLKGKDNEHQKRSSGVCTK